MGDISDLPGIPEPILLLLREAGVETPELLVSLEVGEILIRLDEAHERRGLEVRRPPAELIRAWQMTAREVLRKRAEDPVPDAVEVSPTSLEEAGIDLNAIPVAQLLEPPPPEPPEETWSPPPSASLQLDEPLLHLATLFLRVFKRGTGIAHAVLSLLPRQIVHAFLCVGDQAL